MTDRIGVDSVVLHIGTMKTGTTYLQSRFKHHRLDLEAQGICYPTGQMNAVRDLFGRRGTLGHRDVRGEWRRLVDELHSTTAHRGVISMEYLSVAEPDLIERLIGDLAPAVPEVVLTVRDISKVMVAQWQETLQNKATWSWSEWSAAITAEPRDAGPASTRFWRQHDVLRLVAGWGAVVGSENVRVVTVPPSRESPSALWDRMCAVIGVRGSDFAEPTTAIRSNIGLDAAAAEVLRRLNIRLLERGVSNDTYLRHVKQLLGKHVLAQRSATIKPSLGPEQHAWAVSYTERLITELVERHVRVHGDLAELRPGPRQQEETVTDADVAEAAIDMVLGMVDRVDRLTDRHRAGLALHAGADQPSTAPPRKKRRSRTGNRRRSSQ